MNLSVYKQVEHYKKKVAELRNEYERQKWCVNWYINETSALESKLYAFRQSASYDRLKKLEVTNKHLAYKCERQRKIFICLFVYSVLTTIAVIVLVL